MKKLIPFLVFLLTATWVFGESTIYPKREMRATWLTAVANIDWPIATTKGMQAQQKELIGHFDKCVEFQMNSVLLPIRPAWDVLYKSS